MRVSAKKKIRVRNAALALFLTLQWLGPQKLYVPLQLCRYKYLSINKVVTKWTLIQKEKPKLKEKEFVQ